MKSTKIERLKKIMAKPRDVVGFLTCLSATGKSAGGMKVYEWLCVCGKRVERTRSNMGTTNKTASCGCMTKATLSASKTSHGASKKGSDGWKTFICWQSMIWRCENKNRRDYKDYGGRGISVCDRWREDFSAFIADMGDKPEGMSIDRIDVNGNYEPGNCRWATNIQQSRNRRTNRLLTANGETLTLVEWASRLGVDDSTITHRISAGWSTERAVTVPKFATRRAGSTGPTGSRVKAYTLAKGC